MIYKQFFFLLASFSLLFQVLSKKKPVVSKLTSHYKQIINLGDHQKMYVSYLQNPDVKIIGVMGPAGTGKTMLACYEAIQQLKNNDVDKIILTRPLVPVEEEEIGFLPGNINKKMAPWTLPLFDYFQEFYTQKELEIMIQFNIIEVAPLAFMRGRTFRRSFVIADEMQNSSPAQMLMLSSRLGHDSKMVITGDLDQSDLDNKDLKNGLWDFHRRFHYYQRLQEKKDEILRMTGQKKDGEKGKELAEIRMVEFDQGDIQRSPVVRKIMEMYKWTDMKTIDKTTETMNDAAIIPAHQMRKKNA
jgi:phosphate starvation-inducible PhoH-like protein